MESHFTPEFQVHIESTGEFLEKSWANKILESAEFFFEHGQRELGRGKSGMVWTGSAPEVKDGLCFKAIHTPGIETNTLEAEYQMHQEAEQLGIRVPKLLGFIRTPSDSPFGSHGLLVMEQIRGRTIEEEIQWRAKEGRKWDAEEFLSLGEKIDHDLEILHDHQIYHRDLHFRNVMIRENGEPVFIDFGRSKRVFSSEENDQIYQGTITDHGRRITQQLLQDHTFLPQFSTEALKRNLVTRALDKKVKV